MKEYFVVYDLNDNIVCYLNDKYDFCKFTGIRFKDVRYKFNKSINNFINIKKDEQLLKIYMFI